LGDFEQDFFFKAVNRASLQIILLLEELPILEVKEMNLRKVSENIRTASKVYRKYAPHKRGKMARKGKISRPHSPHNRPQRHQSVPIRAKPQSSASATASRRTS
jgi:hypothetical protein